MCHTDNGFPLQITGGAFRGLPGPTKDYRKTPSYQRLQGPAVHHQDGRLTEIRTLCPGVRTGRFGTLLWVHACSDISSMAGATNKWVRVVWAT